MINQSLLKNFFSTSRHSRFCLIGGGTGSLCLSSHLRKLKGVYDKDIAVFEPNKYHYYQPGWTMVAGGIYDSKNTAKFTRDVFPKQIPIIQEKVKLVNPQQNELTLESGAKWTYDHLIISAGIQCDFSQIKGAIEALQDLNCPVGSAYSKQYAEKMSKINSSFKGGHFVFSEPQLPIKCAGAPQKVLFLSEEQARKKGVRTNSKFSYYCAKGVTFGVKKYSDVLDTLHSQKSISVNHNHKLIEVNKTDKIAVFLNSTNNEKINVNFDALHLVPPQTAPEFIKESGLADAAGFLNINPSTLQHQQYPNIWGLGDSAGTPNSKTAAAIFSQSPVLLNNLQEYIKKGKKYTSYDGYSSCPILIGDNKLLLAEFKYNSVVDETFPFDQGKPRTAFYHLKKSFFPWVYWNLLPRGYWYGRKGIFPHFQKAFESMM